MAHHHYMMLHVVHSLRKHLMMLPYEDGETEQSQSVSAWYGVSQRSACSLGMIPCVLQNQTMYKLGKKNHNKFKQPPPTNMTEWDLDQIANSRTKVKAVSYLDIACDPRGYNRVAIMLSTYCMQHIVYTGADTETSFRQGTMMGCNVGG